TPLQQPFEIIDVKSADADIVLIGQRKFSMQAAFFQAELAEKLPFLDDFFNFLIALSIDIPDLYRSLFYKIDLIVVIGLKIDVLSLWDFYYMMFDSQILV